MKSKTLYIVKAFAALSIVSAHCAFVSPDYSQINLMTSSLLNSIGSIGVGLFLFLAGYFMWHTKQGATSFFIKKLKTLIIPWLFCGTLVYLYVYLRKGGLGIKSLVIWLLGKDTYLYYMSVLCILYLLCYFFRKNKTVTVVFIIISFISNLLTAFGILNIGTPYLNPFNFLIYFSFGLLVAQTNNMDKLLGFSKKFFIPLNIGFVGVFILFAVLDISISYFKWYFIPIEILAALALLGLSGFFAEIKSNIPALFENIGKASFAIYLLHMPIAGIVANIFGRVDIWALTLIRPVIVLGIVYLALIILNWILRNEKLKKLTFTFIGMR